MGVINDDRQILHLGREFAGQRGEHLFRQLLDAFAGYLEHQRSASVSRPRADVTSPIIGAMKSHHLDDAVSAVDLRLDDTEIAALEEAHRPHEVVGFR